MKSLRDYWRNIADVSQLEGALLSRAQEKRELGAAVVGRCVTPSTSNTCQLAGGCWSTGSPVLVSCRFTADSRRCTSYLAPASLL